jgi:hypothetical protein
LLPQSNQQQQLVQKYLQQQQSQPIPCRSTNKQQPNKQRKQKAMATAHLLCDKQQKGGARPSTTI